MSIEQDYYDFTKEAQTLINAKRFDEAFSLLQKSIKNMPAGWKPYIESDERLEIFFWNKSEFLSFVDYNRVNLNKSVFWRFPSYSKAHYQLAYIFSDQGNFEKALNEIEKGLILETDQPRLLCEKAYVLGKMNDLETSLSYLQKAINSRPWNTVEQKIHALRDMAVTQTNLERFDEALDAINEALKIDPSNTELKKDFDYIKSLRPEKKQSAKQPVQKRLLEEGQNLKNTYEVENFLGEGAFAEVYRVKHRLFGRQALKIFKIPGSIEEIRRSLEEAVLLSKLGHRGIIRVFDAGVYENENGNHGYFTMEYIAGGNLYQYWQNYGSKLMTTDECVEIVRQVAEGLALAHQDNPPIVHRDIKPHNILIGYDALGMRACLSDFGLAKHVHPLQLAASVRGTLIYKAPETFSDSAADSCAGDVWALGVDIEKESQRLEKRADSIQCNVIQQLKKKDYDVIFDDDSSGEAADIITIKVDDERKIIDVEFYHCKFSRGGAPGARIDDLYEVCGQSQKSIRWLINPRELFLHLPRREEKRRLEGKVTRIETGDGDKIDEIFEKSDVYRTLLKIFMVQPGLSKEKASQDQLELLAVTDNYLKETYLIPFTVIAST